MRAAEKPHPPKNAKKGSMELMRTEDQTMDKPDKPHAESVDPTLKSHLDNQNAAGKKAMDDPTQGSEKVHAVVQTKTQIPKPSPSLQLVVKTVEQKIDDVKTFVGFVGGPGEKSAKIKSQETARLPVFKPSTIVMAHTRKRKSTRKDEKRKSKNKKTSNVINDIEKIEEDKESESHELATIFKLPSLKTAEDTVVKAVYKESWLSCTYWIEVLVFFYCLADIRLKERLVPLSMEHGGFWFLTSYILLSTILEFPFTNLFIHIGQYTQTGITLVFGRYTRIFEGIGLSFFVLICVASISSLNRGHDRLVVMGSALMFGNVDTQVGCSSQWINDNQRCSLSVKPSEFCCTSVVDLSRCNDSSRKTSLGTECHVTVPDEYRTRMKLASKLYSAQGDDKHQLICLIPLAIAFIGYGIMASFGYYVFTFGLAIITSVAELIFLISGLVFVFKGDLQTGFRELVRTSEPETFFTLTTFMLLFKLCLGSFIFRLGLISFASFWTRKSDSFTITLQVVLIHKFLLILCLISALAMIGHFRANFPNQKISGFDLSASGTKNFVSEFVITTCSYPTIVMFMYFLSTFVLDMKVFAVILYIVLAIYRDHFKADAPYVKYILIAVTVLGLPTFGFCIVYSERFMESLALFYGITAICLAFIGVSTIFIYGQLEHLLDHATFIGHATSITAKVGAAAPMYPRFAGFAVPQYLVVIGCLDIVMSMSLWYNNDDWSNFFAGIVLMATPIAVFVVYTVIHMKRVMNTLDVEDKDNKADGIGQLWRIFYPSPEHPSYSRIMNVVPIKNNENETQIAPSAMSARPK